MIQAVSEIMNFNYVDWFNNMCLNDHYMLLINGLVILGLAANAAIIVSFLKK